MQRVIAVTALLLCSSLFGELVGDKAARTQRLTAIVARIDSIARAGYSDAKRGVIRSEVDALSTPDDLCSLVLLCYGVLRPQQGDESYDFAFEAAIRACLQKLATIPTAESSRALHSLQPLIGHDASLGLEDAIQKQEKPRRDGH
jgi:hypothetical protein